MTKRISGETGYMKIVSIFGFVLLLAAGAYAMATYQNQGEGNANASVPENNTPAANEGSGNRLKFSDSPYLLKHASNPVDWHEWGPEALEKAKKEDKLIFLSVGYTACHWCNELEDEAFRHQDFADVINKRYVSIKVDREQRPDIDKIYMQAAVLLSGRGGWPNNVFLTPDLDPVYAVGYQRREMFKQLLEKVDNYWHENREQIESGGARVSKALKSYLERGGEFKETVKIDFEPLKSAMDMKYGGFGQGTKFPMTTILEFLLTEGGDDEFLKLTLTKMANGGMYDHVGGGFHRYSVDEKWEVPHFEKMLYDNALMANLYARAALIFGDKEYEYIARSILDFVKRELTNEQGGFLSSLDADSEGEEGKFYTWTKDEIDKIAGSNGFNDSYSVTEDGNLDDIVVTEQGPTKQPTGRNVLNLKSDNRHPEALEKLFNERAKRIRPPLDDKVVASWHAMMTSAFANAGVWLNEPKYIEIAEKGAAFSLGTVKLNHFWRQGKGGGDATLSDLAFAAMAFWNLFEATGDGKYLDAAKEYVDIAKRDYAAGDGGYFLIRENTGLIARPRVAEDNPIPSSAAVLARVDWRLAAALGEPERADQALRTANHLLGVLDGVNLFSGEALNLLRETQAERVEVVYAWKPGENKQAEWLRSGVDRQWGVVRIPLGAKTIGKILSEGRLPTDETMAYVCLETICLAPSTTPEEVRMRLKQVRKPDAFQTGELKES